MSHRPKTIVVCCLLGGGLLGAADFQLLSGGVVSAPAQSATNSQGGFSLNQPKLAPIVPIVPSADGRFTLRASAGQIVVVQSPALPQLLLQPQSGGWTLTWSDLPLIDNLILESSSAHVGLPWQAVDCEITATGRRTLITAPLLAGHVRFYRLRKL